MSTLNAAPIIGFIGGGNMAESLIGGLLDQDQVSASDLVLFEPNTERAQQLANTYGLSLADDNEHIIRTCDVVVLAVKPQVLQSVLEPLTASFSHHQPLIVSIAAGIEVSSIEKWLGRECAVVRVMPNTPALIGKGASGLYANSLVSKPQRTLTHQLMLAVGCAVWVPSEADIDSVTALSGSGPAYFMLFIQGLVEAAEQAGMDSETALTLAVQTAAGAAELVATSDQPLQTLIDNVTSPNGTTEQGLLSFAGDDLKGVISNAFNAAKRRSAELADELG